MSARSMQRFLFVIASVLFAGFCISRHSMSTNYLTDQLPTVSTLLAIGCLQPHSSLVSHAPSTSLQLLRRYASVLVGVAILGQHAVEAELEVVNKTTFKDTWYNGSAVSINGPNIMIVLDERTTRANVTWRFNDKWAIQLEKCDGTRAPQGAKIEISDSCKWEFDWDETKRFTLNEDNTWKFPTKNETTPRIRKLRIEIADDVLPSTMSICTVTGKGECSARDLIGPKQFVPLQSPSLCMLTTGDFSVNVTLQDKACPMNVTIINAQLLYDFFEPTTVRPATVSRNDGSTTTLPLWTGTGPAPTGYATRPWTSTAEAPPGFPTWAIIVASVGGFLVLLGVIAIICLIVFCCLPRRRRRQTQLGVDADIQAQVTEKEGLVEWDDVMAHAAYKPKIDEQPDEKDWPFKAGDTVDLSTITECEYSLDSYKTLEFTEDVKGSDDYGVVEGSLEKKSPAVIYYSMPSDRIKTFVDRLNQLYEVDRMDGMRGIMATIVGDVALVPQLLYYWISSDPQKLSYLVLDYHAESVACDVKEGAELYERVGFAYTTFTALLSLHRHGCVHRDVTPAAFVIRHSKSGDDQFCIITHLSLSRMLYNVFRKTWMPRRRRVKYFGSHKYASRAAHAMQERSFKDDLESWFFTAVELIWPTTAKEPVMPWHNFNVEIGVTDRAELHAKYKAEKEKFLRNFSKNKLVVSFPAPQFRLFAKEILKMTYETLGSDYGPKFVQLLNGMMDHLPTQIEVDEDSQKKFLAYMQNFKANLCRPRETKDPVPVNQPVS